MAVLGVKRHAAYRALAALESKGLISVDGAAAQCRPGRVIVWTVFAS